jgi:hypothetical protein
LKDRGRTGFYEYLETGEYTPGFIGDVDVLIAKVYRRWSLYETIDEFHSFCWAKIVNSLKIYDEQGGRETGPLSTYLYQVIMNEARRIWSKHRKMVLEDPSDVSEHSVATGDRTGSDLGLRDRLCAFARRAYSMGVHVDQGVLYRNYCSGKDSSGVRAFKWCSILDVE